MKFNYVAGNLDANYAVVRDILTRPLSTGKFETLKTELIHCLSTSQDEKTCRLLGHKEIGDRIPLQYLLTPKVTNGRNSSG